jgi:putative spermidine/putrescine transport system permease protein
MAEAAAGGASATGAARVAAESTGSRLERRSFTLVFGLLCTVAIVLLMAPTVIVVVTSFTSGFSLKFPPPGWSWRWYLALWNESPEILDAFVLSLKVAAIATSVSIVLAVAAALAIARRREAWARLAESLFLSPLMLPTLALVAITAPYVFRTTAASLLQLDASLLESARSLGASPVHAFRTVTLPLISRGIAAGAFIGFMYSFDNVAVSLFLSDARSEVLPIRMWHIIESNLDVRAAAVSGVLIAATLVMMIVMERLAGISRHLR